MQQSLSTNGPRGSIGIQIAKAACGHAWHPAARHKKTPPLATTNIFGICQSGSSVFM